MKRSKLTLAARLLLAIPVGASTLIFAGALMAASIADHGWHPAHTWLSVGLCIVGYLAGLTLTARVGGEEGK